jgi:hypothetical protein
MKKPLFFTLLLLFITCLSVDAQLDKGKIFISGTSNLGLNFGSESEKVNGDKTDGTGYKYYNFNFQPRAGYLFINNLVGGGYIDMDFYGDKDNDDVFLGTTTKGATFILGPFARYYIHVCDKLIPYAEGQVGFGIDNYKDKYNDGGDWTKYNETVFSYRLGAGATLFFNKMIGADLFLGYLHEAYKHKATDSPERSSDAEKTIYNEFDLQLGIVVILGK